MYLVTFSVGKSSIICICIKLIYARYAHDITFTGSMPSIRLEYIINGSVPDTSALPNGNSRSLRRIQQMTKDKSYLPWPGMDDRIVVEEMLRDHSSGQWHECYMLVIRLVQGQAHNISIDRWEDLVQEAMIRIHKYLPTFQFQCTFKTWTFNIVRSCIIDAYRKSKHAGQFMTPPNDPHNDVEMEGDVFTSNVPGTVEDICILHDELHKALAALLEYVSTHSNPVRNKKILNMVLFENCSLEETAQVVGCSAPVVGYVVRSAQRYVREKLEYQR
jgi:RNA polymerase sigma factor (sigma-70 family)